MSANTPTDLCFSFAGLRRRGGACGPHRVLFTRRPWKPRCGLVDVGGWAVRGQQLGRSRLQGRSPGALSGRFPVSRRLHGGM